MSRAFWQMFDHTFPAEGTRDDHYVAAVTLETGGERDCGHRHKRHADALQCLNAALVRDGDVVLLAPESVVRGTPAAVHAAEVRHVTRRGYLIASTPRAKGRRRAPINTPCTTCGSDEHWDFECDNPSPKEAT
ncbi:hypothetical protein [Candidatus Palauibacter sp.]|uniref:hypothetical protein n=1 Tax=Candidatus Palauibacter sp. TaxID=3101350 RepID=UPI003B5A8366